MSASHTGFILAAYLVTFVVVGGATLSIVARHRFLKQALRRLGIDERSGS